MGSSRETYKQILTKDTALTTAEKFTSTPINVQGRDRATFLVYYATGSVTDTCRMTIEWSFDQGPTDWYPLPEATNIQVDEGKLKRITVSDAFTYLRLRVDQLFANGTISAWSISL